METEGQNGCSNRNGVGAALIQSKLHSSSQVVADEMEGNPKEPTLGHASRLVTPSVEKSFPLIQAARPLENLPVHIKTVYPYVGGRYLLSAWSDGSRVDLFVEDTGTGRQKWELIKGDGDWYNIRVFGGLPNNGRQWLSTNSDSTWIDLWNRDDGSGRQRWRVIDQGGYYHIQAVGGIGRRNLLSCNDDGSEVVLWDHDGGSGRERWIIEGDGCFVTSADEIKGRWIVHGTIASASTETWKIGTHKEHGQSKTEQWSQSATTTVSEGFEFEGLSGGASVSSTIGHDFSDSYHSDWSIDEEHDWSMTWSE